MIVISESDSAIMRLKPNVSATAGIALSYLVAFAISVPLLVIAMLDPSLPSLITALVPMIATVSGVVFTMRRINADRAEARERELRSHLETQGKLQVAELRYLELLRQFEDFKATTKDDARELRSAMMTRDETIKNQTWKIDDLSKRLVIQSALINTVEQVLKQEGFSHVRITAAFLEYNGESHGSNVLDTP